MDRSLSLPYRLQSAKPFELESPYSPQGDQPEAIKKLVTGIQSKTPSHQVLLGVTGSGKTFSMANVIAQVQKPTLVLAPNKTLAAQLFVEFREFFPKNAVEYFVSYYDYYQPEAFIPATNTYIEKDSAINDDIDKLRHSATRSLLDRNDVIIISSVSCIYGLGSPEAYSGMLLYLEEGKNRKREHILKKLVEIQYTRSDIDFHRGTFRVRGDIIDIFPAYEEERAVRVELFGEEVDAIYEIDALRGIKLGRLGRVTVYPASHFVTDLDSQKRAIDSIQVELRERLTEFKAQSKFEEAKRLEQRTLLDIEMIEALGYCQGIENYSRHIEGRAAGETPPTLLDYFPKDFLMIIDESHVTVSQIGGMYRGDRARKMNLVEHGFRLPSALDNRPLNFDEFQEKMEHVVYVSATPGDYELKRSGGEVVEQIIRPTGLLDPIIEVRPAGKQVEDVHQEIVKRVALGDRVLVTTLTKKLSETLTDFLARQGVKVKYLHSDIDTLERVEILRELRQGIVDVIVGINLLREGLDLPEVSLVAILDADKEGFLRSTRSLIQTIGRAARNEQGYVIMYADRMTDSMANAIGETKRRRAVQEAHNQVHGITPTTVRKQISSGIIPGSTLPKGADLAALLEGKGPSMSAALMPPVDAISSLALLDLVDDDERTAVLSKRLGLSEVPKSRRETEKLVEALSVKMKEAAKNLEFEKAVEVRERLKIARQLSLLLK